MVVSVVRGRTPTSDGPSPSESASSLATAAQSGAPSLSLDRDTFAVVVSGAVVTLTKVQFDLLSLLLTNQHRVLSHSEIARDVLSTTCGDMGVLIRVHICHLRRALGPCGAMIATVRGRGYRFVST